MAVALLVIMWLLASHPERIGRLVHSTDRVLPHAGRASAWRTGQYVQFRICCGPRAARFLLALLWSFPLWIVIAAETWAVTRAIGIELPFTGTFLLQLFLVVGVAVPTPGGVGSYHAAYKFGVVSFFGAPEDQAVAAAILVHAIAFMPVLAAWPDIHGAGRPQLWPSQDPRRHGARREAAGRARRATERATGRDCSQMKCPFCGHLGDKVVDSRESKEGEVIRRRRECLDCGRRFTSYERIDEIPYMVIKKDGTRERFERQKLVAGLLKACEKRPVSIAAIESVADKIEARLQDRPEKEMGTEEVGAIVMEELKRLDKVAYVRFASVYRSFRDVGEFMSELKDLLSAKD